MLASPLVVGLLVFALCLGAGLVPVFVKLGPRTLHGVVAAACGLFLGITFLHLLPELAQRAQARSGAPTLLWTSVLAGLLAVFLADVLLRAKEDEHDDQHRGGDHPAHHGGHRVVGFATFVGLSVHTLGSALVIGIDFDDVQMRNALVMATLTHKAAEAFSLASVLLLAELSRRTLVSLLAAYALVTPLGIFAGRAFAGGTQIPSSALGLAEGLAAGTFLYVAVGELLPEVFHGRIDRKLKILLLLAGVAASTALRLAHPESASP